MSDLTVRQALDELKKSFAEATADGSLDLSDYLRLIADGCQMLESTIRGIAGDEQQFNMLVVDCEGFVQEYIVPIDLSKFKVPRMLERMFIDPQLPLAVRPALESMRESLLAKAAKQIKEGSQT